MRTFNIRLLVFLVALLSFNQSSSQVKAIYNKKIIHETNFSDTIYSKAAFGSSRFVNKANFSKSTIKNIFHFSNVTCEDTADFTGVQFDSIANFSSTQFNDYVFFNRAKFRGNASFYSTDFNGLRTNFTDCKFGNEANFYYASFKSQNYFYRTVLPDILYFEGVKSEKEIDLTVAILDSIKVLKNKNYKCKINLVNSEISKIKLNYELFQLWFPKHTSYELKISTYEKLLNKFKEEGFLESYEILDKEYREFKYIDQEGHYNIIWGYFLNWINKLWWGYGYDKECIILNVLLIYLFLSFINVCWLKHLVSKVYINTTISELLDSQNNKSRIKFLLVKLRYSLFYTAFIFFSFKYDMSKLVVKENLMSWKKVFNLIYFFIIYLGGFVCLAYLANFIITV